MADRQADTSRSHEARLHSEVATFTRQLGQNIAERRKQMGMTQDELAGQAGLSRASIANVERGAQSPQIFSLVLVARSLGCSVADLVPEAMIGADDLTLSSDSRAAVERVLQRAQRQRAEAQR